MKLFPSDVSKERLDPLATGSKKGFMDTFEGSIVFVFVASFDDMLKA